MKLITLIAASFLVLSSCATGKKSNLTPTQHARMLVEVANGALADGDPTSALESLALAEKEEPSLPELYHTKALVFHVKGESDLALENSRKAVQMKPDYADANNTLGKFLMDSGNPSEAIPYLNKAAHDPMYREAFKAYSNLGILHYRAGRFPEAKVAFDKAINQGMGQACIAHYYRGHISLKSSRFREAIQDYDQATRNACGSFQDAHLALGIAYERSGDYNRARRKFVEIQQQFPSTRTAAQAVNRLQGLP